MFGRSALMSAYIPNDIPEFLRDQRLVSILDNDLLAFRRIHSGFVLVGDGGTFLQMRITEVSLILKNVGDRSTAPTVRTLHVHSRLSFPILSIIVMGGSQYLLTFQNARDLIRAFATGAQFKDVLHDGSGFFIGNDFLTVCGTLLVAIRRFAAVAFTTLGLHPFDSTNLFTGVFGVEFVCPVADGIEIGAARHQRIHRIVDCNEADALLREVDLRVVTNLQIFTTKSAEVFDDQGFHLVIFNHLNNLFPGRPLKVCAGVAIVSKEYDILETIIFRVLFK